MFVGLLDNLFRDLPPNTKMFCFMVFFGLFILSRLNSNKFKQIYLYYL